MNQQPRRRVVAQIVLSLDGRTTGPEGPYDMSWIVPHAVTDNARAMLLRMTEVCTTALLGRTNYEGFRQYWPHVALDPDADPRDRAFAEWFDKVDKVVFSTTLTEATWENSRIVNASPTSVVAELRAEPGGDIYVLSSQSIMRQLLADDQIDRLSLNLAPELVGGGQRLFDDTTPASSWAVVEQSSAGPGGIWLLLDRRGAPDPDGQHR
jgi:dihydrofolate reductase